MVAEPALRDFVGTADLAFIAHSLKCDSQTLEGVKNPDNESQQEFVWDR